MTNYATGHLAEKHVADYLQKQGYKILATNWRTRYCEIDIVAQKHKTVHFIEVKYRRSGTQGTGLEYVTESKLKRMRFAAEFWVAEHNWRGEYALGAVEVSDPGFSVSHFLPVLE